MFYTTVKESPTEIQISVFWNSAESMYKLPDSCSVFSAESFAIIEALQIITNYHLQDTIIFTDPVSAINNIKNTYNHQTLAYIFRIKCIRYSVYSYVITTINSKLNFSGFTDTQI